MTKSEVIVVFDIGKTNKKLLLFNNNFEVVYQHEEKFPTVYDEDGFECDDIELIEDWIIAASGKINKASKFDVVGVNFSTYGASLVFLDKAGKRITPVYNYLKEIPSEIQDNLFKENEGVTEFCRKTASPALGLLLNSGIQILWLKNSKSEFFTKVKHILHFPQYLSYLFTKQIVSEPTSVGCHTFLWDFDNNRYHEWLTHENIKLPELFPNNMTFPVEFDGTHISCGIGIHDSSASLMPYLTNDSDKFMLISTGTWCVNMNPFNHSNLTAEQLNSDCLSYISVDQKPVKSSRLFLGHIHDVNANRIAAYFDEDKKSYKKVEINELLIKEYIKTGNADKVFFKKGLPEYYKDETVDLGQFDGFGQAYHRFMFDLTLFAKNSINLVLTEDIIKFYVSGGFARNELFVKLLATFYPDITILTSELDNSSALGAALVIKDVFSSGSKGKNLNLGLRQYSAIK